MTAQNFTYDWSGNITQSTSDLPNSGFYDRSLGTSTFQNNQLVGSYIGTATSGKALGAIYDKSGNLKDLWVDRSGETCASGGAPISNQNCSQRYIFEWDEIGNLAHTRRWDYAAPPLSDPSYPGISVWTPQIDDLFTYSGHDRVIKSQSVRGDVRSYDVNMFDSLVLRGTTFGGDYLRNEATESVYLDGYARVLYLPGLPTPAGDNRHVFFELQDGLSSVDTIVDRETSEVVERRTSQAYGQDESEYRPDRWGAFREDQRYTGKTDDIDIGLVYFGYRYYSPALMRWISADPLTIHGLGSTSNPYAYVAGNPSNSADPTGLDTAFGEQPKTLSGDGSPEHPYQLDVINTVEINSLDDARSLVNKATPLAIQFPSAAEQNKMMAKGAEDAYLRLVLTGAAASALMHGDITGAARVLGASPHKTFDISYSDPADRDDVQRAVTNGANKRAYDAGDALFTAGIMIAGGALGELAAGLETAADGFAAGDGPITTVIGRMQDLERFTGVPGYDTWTMSGRIPAAGEPPVIWDENMEWLAHRIARGDNFAIDTDPATLPPVKNGFIPGKLNGYFTAREYLFLRQIGIQPIRAY